MICKWVKEFGRDVWRLVSDNRFLHATVQLVDGVYHVVTLDREHTVPNTIDIETVLRQEHQNMVAYFLDLADKLGKTPFQVEEQGPPVYLIPGSEGVGGCELGGLSVQPGRHPAVNQDNAVLLGDGPAAFVARFAPAGWLAPALGVTAQTQVAPIECFEDPCPHCGAKLPDVNASPVVCSKCGEEVE